MKTKYTPGPWTHDPVWSLITACAGKYEIAALHAAGNETTRRRNIEEVLANAKLIASAPELLEALELAQATIERLHRHAPGSANGTLDVIKAAISKAT